VQFVDLFALHNTILHRGVELGVFGSLHDTEGIVTNHRIGTALDGWSGE
jgi:hypothetical protein